MLKKILAIVVMLFATAVMAAVDVNKATEAELDAVKGIGPVTSKLIISERKKGEFKSWQDFIDRVKGVGDTRAAKLSAEGLTVSGSTYKAMTTSKDAKTAAKDEKKEAKTEAKIEKKEAKAVAAAEKKEAKATTKEEKAAAKDEKKDAKAEAKAEKKEAKAEAKADAAKPAASAAKAASAKK
ncbi:MAG TPA: helix-hairpin-helix domain-containing protein [Ramlibacter sp.]|nr:helix-hairpin-helix domain-containing protein [Ramlibacter sp.]